MKEVCDVQNLIERSSLNAIQGHTLQRCWDFNIRCGSRLHVINFQLPTSTAVWVCLTREYTSQVLNSVLYKCSGRTRIKQFKAVNLQPELKAAVSR